MAKNTFTWISSKKILYLFKINLFFFLDIFRSWTWFYRQVSSKHESNSRLHLSCSDSYWCHQAPYVIYYTRITFYLRQSWWTRFFNILKQERRNFIRERFDTWENIQIYSRMKEFPKRFLRWKFLFKRTKNFPNAKRMKQGRISLEISR